VELQAVAAGGPPDGIERLVEAEPWRSAMIPFACSIATRESSARWSCARRS
jgi:hypothetical protein